MKTTARATLLALSAALALLSAAALDAQLAESSMDDAALAEARARLAASKGKSELAAGQWRKVLAHRESRLKTVQEMYTQGRVCSPDAFHEARGAVSFARAKLAEVEGRRDDLVTELPGVIAYYERRVQRYDELRLRNAIAEKDAKEALTECDRELQWARQRLAALRDDEANRAKVGNVAE